MAPTAPKKRPTMRSKLSKPTSLPSTATSTSTTKSTTTPAPSSSSFPPFSQASSASAFINSKTDKRTIRHSTFISRIEKSHTKPLKRRRPNKKLVTTLEGLADALPDVETLVREARSGGGKKLESKSLSHGKGFMKRRDKVERGERERFGKNLGVIMGAGQQEVVVAKGGGEGEVKAPSATKGRFAAIRAWVNDNMEKHEGFEKKE